MLLFTTCSQVFSKFDNPVDPDSTEYQGYEAIVSIDAVHTFTPVADASLDATPSQFVVSCVIGADFYHLQISSNADFNPPLLLDKSDYFDNKMSPGSVVLPRGSVYYWRAKAYRGGAWGEWTSVASFALGFKVSYTGNGNTGGSVPVDSTRYLPGESVTVLGNTGDLIKTGYVFNGWNTEENGSGVNREEGSSFVIGSSDITLYAKWRDYSIGDTGPAGGLVFYDKGSYSDGWRYLEAAPSDQSKGIQWYNGSYITTGATATGIGSGIANTATIVSAQGAGKYAASLCANLVLGGCDDWFLPSMDELDKIYQNLKVAGRGSIASAWYWSSSENNNGSARLQNFNDGSKYNDDRSINHYVRAVRAF